MELTQTEIWYLMQLQEAEMETRAWENECKYRSPDSYYGYADDYYEI